MAQITIDGVDYETDQLTDEVKEQIQAIHFVDSELVRLAALVAALQTSRNAYSQAVQQMLEQSTPSTTQP